MNTLQSKQEYMHRFVEPITGCVLAFISLTWWQNFLFAMFTAFMGAIVGYIAKKLCDHFYNKYIKKRWQITKKR